MKTAGVVKLLSALTADSDSRGGRLCLGIGPQRSVKHV